MICPKNLLFLLLSALLAAAPTQAGAAQGEPLHIPPPGIAVPDADRQELTAAVSALGTEISALERKYALDDRHRSLLPDIVVFHKAVDWALRYDEFFDSKQIAFARTLLRQGRERAEQLRSGNAPWLSATGLVVRGYPSRLDGSTQPYGLVLPASVRPHEDKMRPLYVWLAGRGEKRTELAFLAERENSPGPFVPADTIVVHPYGRFCNANKFAGEVDVFEAIAAVCSQYTIDPDRMVVAGFSMGGASTWHLATHHAGLWCAAAPGAGFAETAVFSKIFEGKEPPPWWEQKLWRWYDATIYAGNLFNCPTIAYSGEIDGQKQAADIMEKYMASEGLKLDHLIGPQTAHKYHPETQKQLAGKLDALVAKGRDPLPSEVHLTTYTLQYPQVAWVRVEGLEHHWERADIRARIVSPGVVTLTTTNVTALKLLVDTPLQIGIDGQSLKTHQPRDREIALVREDGHWSLGERKERLRKRRGLTGPVDDAFMSAFLFVRPTSKSFNEKVGEWTRGELDHAVKMWRDTYRGDAPIKDDKDVTKQDIETRNLVVWGDPSSNKLLAKALKGLPLKWGPKEMVFGEQKYDAAHTAPILIFPNPLNPKHYILLNSGIDFRSDAYGSNAKQTPKLPDWAMIDLDTAPGPRWPGKIIDAGFFDEDWHVQKTAK